MSFRDARSAQADTRTRESARHTRPACGRLAGDGNRQEQAARVALYPQASRRVHALPQPRRQPVTHLRRAVVLPLTFPPGDKPAPIRPDHNNGPVTATTVPAHDRSKEDFDGHHAE